jgi:purine-binding chemotaxis protein CheW
MVNNFQVVVFTVGKELYAVGIDSVQEIVRVPDITEVPDAPVFLEGVINLRGRVVPVIDLRKRLRLDGIEKTKSTRVLVAEKEESLVGLLVDSVFEVLKIRSDDVEEPPEIISAIGIEYITGVAKMAGKLIILLDLTKILNAEDMRSVDMLQRHAVAGEIEVIPEDDGKRSMEEMRQ